MSVPIKEEHVGKRKPAWLVVLVVLTEISNPFSWVRAMLVTKGLKPATGREILLPDWLHPTGEPGEMQDTALLLSREVPPGFTAPLSTTTHQGSSVYMAT